jgi:2-amino-4-hydroxy-6-hydroxymethyldihydropteridine diphosphokinase
VKPPRRAVVGLGSNLGDRAAAIDDATRRLAATAGVQLIARSPVYETDPVGGPPQGAYLNAAALIRTELEPRELLERLLAIESTAGRTRDGTRDAPRTIDLDLLWIDGVVLAEPGLEVPHPRLADRAFALVPLLDVAPDARDENDRRYDGRPAAGVALRFVAPAAPGEKFG